MTTSDAILKFCRMARMNCYLQFAFIGLFILFVTIAVWESPNDARKLAPLMVGLLVALVLPVALFVLAKKLEAGKPWAGYGMFIVAGLMIVNLFLTMLVSLSRSGSAASGVCMMIGGLPVLILVAAGTNAFGEIRHMGRVLRREREAKLAGFPVIQPASPAGKTPAATSQAKAVTPPRPTTLAQTKPPPPSNSRRR